MLKTKYLLFFNEFRKNPVLKIAYIIYFLPTFAWSVYSFVNSLIYKEIFFGLCFTLVVSLIYFVFFAFISYEFGRMDSSVGFDECCSAIKFGRVKTIGARILVMISLSIPCFILNLLFFIVVGLRRRSSCNISCTCTCCDSFCGYTVYWNAARGCTCNMRQKRLVIYRIACYYFLFEPCGKWLLRGFILFHWYIRKQMVKSFPFYDAVVIFLYT